MECKDKGDEVLLKMGELEVKRRMALKIFFSGMIIGAYIGAMAALN